MKPPRPRECHLETRTALDYLDSRLSAPGRRAVEEHLGSPCSACRELVRELGWLVGRMRLDRAAEVPEDLRARALAVFAPQRPFAPAPRGMARLARLVFDSLNHPVPAGALRAVGAMRRLRFALGPDHLEIESEVESSETRTLRGRLQAADPTLHRLEVSVGRERLLARPDADGAFVFEHMPRGPARLTVIGPRQRYRLPSLE